MTPPFHNGILFHGSKSSNNLTEYWERGLFKVKRFNKIYLRKKV